MEKPKSFISKLNKKGLAYPTDYKLKQLCAEMQKLCSDNDDRPMLCLLCGEEVSKDNCDNCGVDFIVPNCDVTRQYRDKKRQYYHFSNDGTHAQISSDVQDDVDDT